MEKALLALASKHIQTATAKALTRLATGARTEVMTRMETLFDKPTPFTVKSIRYEMATRESLESRVYISDAAATGRSPHKYLGPEIEGGDRHYKRAEKALIAKGIMRPGQWIMPAEGMPLDAYGNIPGPMMVQILSRLSAFGEMGYRANVSQRMLRKLKKSKMASRRLANAKNGDRVYGGTEYFVKRDRGGQPWGIFKLISKGRVVPILYFANRNPVYPARFPFEQMVKKHADANFQKEMMRALMEEIAKDSK